MEAGAGMIAINWHQCLPANGTKIAPMRLFHISEGGGGRRNTLPACGIANKPHMEIKLLLNSFSIAMT
jgi:hypothetical protein